jgi:hypothetical protein
MQVTNKKINKIKQNLSQQRDDQGRSDRGCGGVNPPPTVKIRQKSGKIQVKILTFSGKICLIK